MRTETVKYADEIDEEITEEQFQAAMLKLKDRIEKHGSFIFGVDSIEESCIAIPLSLYLTMCPHYEAEQLVEKFESLIDSLKNAH